MKNGEITRNEFWASCKEELKELCYNGLTYKLFRVRDNSYINTIGYAISIEIADQEEGIYIYSDDIIASIDFFKGAEDEHKTLGQRCVKGKWKFIPHTMDDYFEEKKIK